MGLAILLFGQVGACVTCDILSFSPAALQACAQGTEAKHTVSVSLLEIEMGCISQ